MTPTQERTIRMMLERKKLPISVRAMVLYLLSDTHPQTLTHSEALRLIYILDGAEDATNRSVLGVLR